MPDAWGISAQKQKWQGPTALGERSRRGYKDGASGPMKLMINGCPVTVQCDPDLGPQVLTANGDFGYLGCVDKGAKWSTRSPWDRRVLAYQAAVQNSKMEMRNEQTKALQMLRDQEAAALRDWEQLPGEEKALRRCDMEMAKKPVQWIPISIEQVSANHTKICPGIIYGMDFPWSAESLEEFGPDWLTKAFLATGVIGTNNAVTSLTLEKKIKIDAGNNAGKFLFEVTYRKKLPDLHTRLFAKVPFAMTQETQADRFSSSVYKQPMDLHEINSYRLLEAKFPVKTPKFYFGDISCESSNFILITERIPYADIGTGTEEEEGSKRKALKPLEVEGPYDKCKDYQLRGPIKEYYMTIFRAKGAIAGKHKTGGFGGPEVMCQLGGPRAPADAPWAWGMNPQGSSGEAPGAYVRKLEAAVKFMELAKVCFPSYVTDENFQKRWTRTMLKWSAYGAETQYWKNSNPDYMALGHNNLNADNAYFWRDVDGGLKCGVIDWGGFGTLSMGHKIWWVLNCADHDEVAANLSDYIAAFCESYESYGAVKLDQEVLRMQVMITVMENVNFMVAAVPNCFKMCAQKEWATIKDRRDPRIAGNIHGKSTLRTTLHVLDNGIRMIEEVGAGKALDDWIEQVYVAEWKQPAKTDSMIFP